LSIKIVIILIIIKATKLSIFYLNNYFILRSNTYSESEDKSDLKKELQDLGVTKIPSSKKGSIPKNTDCKISVLLSSFTYIS